LSGVRNGDSTSIAIMLLWAGMWRSGAGQRGVDRVENGDSATNTTRIPPAMRINRVRNSIRWLIRVVRDQRRTRESFAAGEGRLRRRRGRGGTVGVQRISGWRGRIRLLRLNRAADAAAGSSGWWPWSQSDGWRAVASGRQPRRTGIVELFLDLVAE